jgi:cellobiose dehydrogenase (acceptor)
MPYANTTIEVFKSSSINATHWQADFVCSKGCSDWYGGEIDPNYNNATLGYSASNLPVETPDHIPFHTLAYAHFGIDLSTAKHPMGEFDMLLKQQRRVRR